MSVTVDSGWHPSHLETFDVQSKQTRIVLFRHNRDCNMSTNLTLTADKQVPARLRNFYDSNSVTSICSGFEFTTNRCNVFKLKEFVAWVSATLQRLHHARQWEWTWFLQRVSIMQSTVLAIVNPSVRLSVCLNVCHTLALCHYDSCYGHGGLHWRIAPWL